MSPFLDIDAFASEYGPLTAGERTQAERLLTGLSDLIRDEKPDVDETRAAQVVFEVTRDAIKYADIEKFKAFQNITSRRQESGTLRDDALSIDDCLTKRQKKFLGLVASPRPAYYFGD